MIVDVLCPVTPAFVEIANVAVVLPDATVTDAGTVATLVADELRLTETPPVPAAPDNVTVPVEGLPAVTEVGEMVKALRVTAADDVRGNRHIPRP